MNVSTDINDDYYVYYLVLCVTMYYCIMHFVCLRQVVYSSEHYASSDEGGALQSTHEHHHQVNMVSAVRVTMWDSTRTPPPGEHGKCRHSNHVGLNNTTR